ncbi:MAG: NAD(P)/FAD-dependent oxidoreductase, partial [Bosea sp. (in: a-proteobacteria)]
MADVDCIVAGAGVVGLAIARALALSGREVLVLDAREGIGTQTSSRNSEVIHAGLYYPDGSLKARLCVAGKHALYAYLAERGLGHARCGKLIVATNESQLQKLHAIMTRAAAAGVNDLELIDRAAISAMEPEVAAIAAIWSPSTGVVDSHAFMLSLQGDIENAGGILAFHAPIQAVRRENGVFIVETGGTEPATISANLFINSAGHGAPALAAKLADYP